MKTVLLMISLISIIFALAGCEGVSQPYVMKMDRVDQELQVGNRGYLKGTPPPPKDRGELKREMIAIDIDLPEVGRKEAETVEPKPYIEKMEERPEIKEEVPAKEEVK